MSAPLTAVLGHIFAFFKYAIMFSSDSDVYTSNWTGVSNLAEMNALTQTDTQNAHARGQQGYR